MSLIEQHEAAHQQREEIRRGDQKPDGWVRVLEYVDCCPACQGAPILEGHENAARIFCQCRMAWPNPRRAKK